MLSISPPANGAPLAARLGAAEVPLTTLASPAFSASLAVARKLAIRAMRACSPASLLIRTKSRKLVFDLMQRYHAACCEYLKHNRPDVLHVMTPDPGAVMLIRAARATGNRAEDCGERIAAAGDRACTPQTRRGKGMPSGRCLHDAEREK